MNGYSQTRKWFDWCFENPRKARPIHGILFLWCIEKANRLGWAEEFQLPSDEAAAACGAADRETILKAIDDLESWGFIKVIQQAKNRFTARWIKVISEEIQLNGSLKSAILYHPKKPDARPDAKSDAKPDAMPILKSVLFQPIINNKTNETLKLINKDFENFWNAYGKKRGLKKCLVKWEQLSREDHTAIMIHIPNYVHSTPNIQYRKDPLTYLNGEGWKDDIIQISEGTIKSQKHIINVNEKWKAENEKNYLI